MVETLPTKQRLGLTQALDQWPSWDTDPTLTSRPKLTRKLGNGLSNHSYLVGAQQQKFVVRLDGSEILPLKLRRDHELQAQTAAWQQGLAPRPVYQNNKAGIFISEYICDKPKLITPEGSTSTSIAQISELLINIHSLPPLPFELDLAARAMHYKALALSNYPQHSALLEDILGNLRHFVIPAREMCDQLVCCHNDLLAANRIHFNERLIAIDWEYAAMGDPYFELAAIIEGDHLSDAESTHLVACYTAKNPSFGANTGARLKLNRLIYRCIDIFWSLATAINADTTSINIQIEKLRAKIARGELN